MGADFVALRCAECSIFQVQQHKPASKKWQCRVCNARQSVVRVYARDAKASNVRGAVHELSRLQGEGERLVLDAAQAGSDEDGPFAPVHRPVLVPAAQSKWQRLADASLPAPPTWGAPERGRNSEEEDDEEEKYGGRLYRVSHQRGRKRSPERDDERASGRAPTAKTGAASKWSRFC
jgi:hypothetical protein